MSKHIIYTAVFVVFSFSLFGKGVKRTDTPTVGSNDLAILSELTTTTDNTLIVSECMVSNYKASLGTRNNLDTSKKENRIKFVSVKDNDEVFMRYSISVAQTVEVSVYNIIGKKVKDVRRMQDDDGDNDISFYVGDLPNGLYFVNVQGSNFRIAEKFNISR